MTHLLPFKITLEGIKEEPVVRDRKPNKVLIRRERKDEAMVVPVKDLLLLLSTNALILEQQVKEGRLRKET